MEARSPTIDWYLGVSRERGVSPRCPFASTERCPRFFQSIALLSRAGHSSIPDVTEQRLTKHWSQSDLWPTTADDAPSIHGNGERFTLYANFCPEVLYEGFGFFASSLGAYADEIDQNLAHKRLGGEGASSDDPRWQWAHIRSMHFTECPTYSPLSHGGGFATKRPEASLKLNLLFLTIDISSVPLSEWWVRAKSRVNRMFRRPKPRE